MNRTDKEFAEKLRREIIAVESERAYLKGFIDASKICTQLGEAEGRAGTDTGSTRADASHACAKAIVDAVEQKLAAHSPVMPSKAGS